MQLSLEFLKISSASMYSLSMEDINRQLGKKHSNNIPIYLLAISKNGVVFWELKTISAEKSLGLILLLLRQFKSALYSALKPSKDWIICWTTKREYGDCLNSKITSIQIDFRCIPLMDHKLNGNEEMISIVSVYS